MKGQGRSVRHCGIHIFGGGGNEGVVTKCLSLWYSYFWCWRECGDETICSLLLYSYFWWSRGMSG